MEAVLRSLPHARERKNKDKLIAEILRVEAPELATIEKEVLIKCFKSYSTYDRAWRKVTRDNEELRGKDYNEKFHLEDEKLEELGYK